MLAALYGQEEPVRIAHSLEGLKHGYGNLAATTGTDFVSQNLAGTAAHNKNLSPAWLRHTDKLLRGSGELPYNCSNFHSHTFYYFSNAIILSTRL